MRLREIKVRTRVRITPTVTRHAAKSWRGYLVIATPTFTKQACACVYQDQNQLSEIDNHQSTIENQISAI